MKKFWIEFGVRVILSVVLIGVILFTIISFRGGGIDIAERCDMLGGIMQPNMRGNSECVDPVTGKQLTSL